ncbi:MAG: TIGR03905 family TSCPD domain-containing protein [Clostridia bacterium]|nr:TIGR03905 family TSCPD domain-containing protein [Clostridia bacterium]
MKHYTYHPEGVCSVQIDYDIEDGKIYNLKYIGGCNGNLKAIGSLVEGMKVEDVIAKLKGIECGIKETSCGDQLAKSLEKIINE